MVTNDLHVRVQAHIIWKHYGNKFLYFKFRLWLSFTLYNIYESSIPIFCHNKVSISL